MLFDLTFMADLGLLALRIITAIVFFSSGKSHFLNPQERGKSIGMPPAATKIIGGLEVLAALSLALGIYVQLGAAIIVLVMLGALQKKIFVWKTKFYEDKGYGWHYDVIFLAIGLLLLGTAGKFVLLP